MQTGRIPGAAALAAVDSENRRGDHAFSTFTQGSKASFNKKLCIFFYFIVIDKKKYSNIVQVSKDVGPRYNFYLTKSSLRYLTPSHKKYFLFLFLLT